MQLPLSPPPLFPTARSKPPVVPSRTLHRQLLHGKWGKHLSAATVRSAVFPFVHAFPPSNGSAVARRLWRSPSPLGKWSQLLSLEPPANRGHLFRAWLPFCQRSHFRARLLEACAPVAWLRASRADALPACSRPFIAKIGAHSMSTAAAAVPRIHCPCVWTGSCPLSFSIANPTRLAY